MCVYDLSLLLALLIPAASGTWSVARCSDQERIARLLAVISSSCILLLLSAAVIGRAELLVDLTPVIRLHLHPDPAGILFAGLASILWILAVIYSLGYMVPGKERNACFFGYFTLAQASIVGIAMAGNLLTLYFFYEALTLLTYPLVTHKQDDPALAAGRTYMAYSLFGAALILIGLVGLQSSYGHLTFVPGGMLPAIAFRGSGSFLLCLLIGFGVKAALMPTHGWLPQAMVAPTPVSALLHAVAVVKSGVFGILRIVYGVYGVHLVSTLPAGQILTVLSIATILIASLLALRQDPLKRRLAFSTIAQLSYIILGASLLTVTALTGALLHLVNHALLKLILFLAVGVIMTQANVDKVSAMNGAFRRFPITMTCFAIASLGMIGVLPTNGFLGKWHLISGALASGHYIAALTLVISAILGALYLLPIVIRAIFNVGEFARPERLEAPAAMLIPIVVLTVFSIIIGLWPGPLLEFITGTATAMIGL